MGDQSRTTGRATGDHGATAPTRGGWKRGHLLVVDGEVMVAGAFCLAPVPVDADSHDDPHHGERTRGFSAFGTRREALGYGARLPPVLHLELGEVEENRVQLVARYQRTVAAELAHRCDCGRPAVPGCARSTEARAGAFGWYGREYGPGQVAVVLPACEKCAEPDVVGKVAAAGVALTVRSAAVQAWCERTAWQPPTTCCCKYRQTMWEDHVGTHGGWKRWHRHLRGEHVLLDEERRADGRREGFAALGRCTVCRTWWHELHNSLAPDGWMQVRPVSDEEAAALRAAAPVRR